MLEIPNVTMDEVARSIQKSALKIRELVDSMANVVPPKER
jgi:hypothetical protein